MPNKNPYSKASSAYGITASSGDQRSMEGMALMFAARKLEDLVGRLQSGEKIRLEEIGETLTHNRKLWQLFVGDMNNPDHPLPLEIKNNIASLAFFVFKRTQEILIETQPEKFQALININRAIAAGLMKKTAAPAPTPQHTSTEIASTDSLA